MSAAMRTLALFAMLFAAAVSPASGQEQEPGPSLTIVVTGAEAGVGQIGVQLFADEAAFMHTPRAQARADVDRDGQAAFVFDDLPVGDYAVSAYYDRDGNGEFDTGLLGIPREKFGFSNNAWGSFGPASWENARFEISEDAAISIALRTAGR